MENNVHHHGIRPALKKVPVAQIIGKSTRGLELMVRNGQFPKPFYAGDRSPRWLAEDVERWLKEKAAEAQGSVPITTQSGNAPRALRGKGAEASQGNASIEGDTAIA